MLPITGYRLQSTDPLRIRALLDVASVADLVAIHNRVIDCLGCYDLSGWFGHDAWLKSHALSAFPDGVLLELQFSREPRTRRLRVTNSAGEAVDPPLCMRGMYREQRMDDILFPLLRLAPHPSPDIWAETSFSFTTNAAP